MSLTSPRSQWRALALGLAAAVLLLLSAALPGKAVAAPAIDGISARAVDDAGKPLDSAYFVTEQQPGSQFTGRIAVTNSGEQAARLHVDAVDAVTNDRGGTVFAPRDDPDRATGAWMRPTKELIRVDPGETNVISFTVDVPEDALAGDHVGGIAIEPLRRSTSGGQFSVTQVLRVVIATQIQVPGETREALTPDVLRLEAIRTSEIPALYVRLANEGDLLCRPELRATLAREGGAEATERREVDTILPRTTIDYPLYWPRGLEAGRYNAVVTTSGCGASREVSTVVELSEDLSGQTRPAQTGPVESGSAGLPTWAIVAGGIGVALLFAALGWWLSRRSARRARERLLRELRDARASVDGEQQRPPQQP